MASLGHRWANPSTSLSLTLRLSRSLCLAHTCIACMYVCVPDVDASLAAYPRQKFRIMQSKHLLITFIISTATVAQSRNLTPDPPVTPLPYPTPNTVHLACCFRQADQVATGCVAEGGVACLLYLPHHMWLAVNKQPTPTHAHTHTQARGSTPICAK